MLKRTHNPQIDVTTYFANLNGEEVQLGTVYGVTTGTGSLYIAQGHDFNGDFADDPSAYDQINLGTFADQAEAERALETNARNAQAPDTVPEVAPTTHQIADAIQAVVGSQGVVSTTNGEATVNALIVFDMNSDAAVGASYLSKAFPMASLRRNRTVVRMTFLRDKPIKTEAAVR